MKNKSYKIWDPTDKEKQRFIQKTKEWGLIDPLSRQTVFKMILIKVYLPTQVGIYEFY